MAISETTTTHRCDIGDHDFDGEVFEARTGNWLVPGDMVCVMATCEAHSEAAGAHPRAWWVEWLRTEGATFGYSSLS
jgi:hypothetical protein